MNWRNIHRRLLSSMHREWRASWISTSEIEDHLKLSKDYFGKLCRGEYNFKLTLFLRAIDALGLDHRTFFSRALKLHPGPEDYLWQLEDPNDGDRAFARMARATREMTEPPPADPRASATADDVADVAACSRKDQLRRLSVVPKYRNQVFARAYLEHLDELRYDDAELAARLATRLAVQLIPALPGPQEERLALQYLALGVFGSARRQKGEFASAARALRLPLELTRRAGLRADRGNLLLRAAYVLKDFGHFHRALALLNEAVAIFVRLGSRWDTGRALVDHGIMRTYLGEFETAVDDFKQALVHLAGSEMQLSRNHLSAYQATAYAYEQLGKLAEAQECLACGVSAFGAGRATDAARLQWVGARLAYRHGDCERAEELLQSARAVLADKEFPGREAKVTLDLISVLLAQGKGKEAAGLAVEMTPLLLRFTDNPMAEAMVFELIKAANEGRLSESIVDEARRKLEGERTPREGALSLP